MAAVVVDMHRDVVMRLTRGDRSAQRELYDLYSRAMYNVCMRILNRREDAEDVLQEVFVVAFKQVESFRFDSTFGAWLKKITVNRCINFVNKRRVQLCLVDDYEKVNHPEVDESTDWEQVQLTVDKVHKAMINLPEGCRIVFSLFMLEGYDHSEIAEILGVSESTSKSQLFRAKQLIRNEIKEHMSR